MSRVYVAKCSDYDPDAIEAVLHESLRRLWGDASPVKSGQKVLLKPNLLQGQPPEKAVTTHPTVVAAVARWVRKAGATPIIADSPGGLFTVHHLQEVYEKTGMIQAAAEGGAVLSYDVRTTRLSFPQGRMVKMLDAIQVAAEADAIISLPKLKTHDLTLLTGATKNLFGTVPGVAKAGYHTKLPEVARFSEMLIDILDYYRPVLTVMDAVVGMEGDGPSGGDPRHIGLLLSSADGVAMDVVAASIVGMAPLSVPPIAAAVRAGLSTGRLEDIEVLGSSVASVRVSGFKKPRTGSRDLTKIPPRLRSWVSSQLLASPRAGPRCTACGVCVENCPVQAISIVAQTARMDLKRCIRCYCCHELCRENAVELRQSLVGRLIHRLER